MPIHITVDAATRFAANRWIDYQNPQITEDRRNQILPVSKYNLLVSAFNASTVILVIAVASTILFAYSAAVALGSIAIFTRFMTEKELHTYTLPVIRNPEPQAANDYLYYVLGVLRHTYNQLPQQEKEDNIFARLQVAKPANWSENEVYIFDYAVWKNRAPLPEPAR